jgi:hypothetical protein
MSIIGYRIYVVTHVDHPELRDASYRVRTVHKVASERFAPDSKIASQICDALLRGEEDFASEYVSSVSARAITGTTKTGRWLRAGVVRYRAADGTMYDDSTPERAGMMRAAEMRDHSEQLAAHIASH